MRCFRNNRGIHETGLLWADVMLDINWQLIDYRFWNSSAGVWGWARECVYPEQWRQRQVLSSERVSWNPSALVHFVNHQHPPPRPRASSPRHWLRENGLFAEFSNRMNKGWKLPGSRPRFMRRGFSPYISQSRRHICQRHKGFQLWVGSWTEQPVRPSISEISWIPQSSECSLPADFRSG